VRRWEEFAAVAGAPKDYVRQIKANQRLKLANPQRCRWATADTVSNYVIVCTVVEPSSNIIPFVRCGQMSNLDGPQSAGH
jgi:hypothetical protein